MATYPTILVGDLVTADLLTSMLPQTYTKASSTTRVNNSVLADDELAGIALAIGTYRIEFIGSHTQTNVTPKIQTKWGFTGTWNTPNRICTGPGNVQTGGPAAVTDSTMASVATNVGSTYSGAITNPLTWREISQSVTVTVAGNLSLDWGQVTTTAANTILLAGSGFLVQRIG